VTADIPIILNPTAGGGRLLRHRLALDAVAHGHGVSLSWRPTAAPGHATELAREARRGGAPLVLAFGGDGTYNEVARGLLGGETSLGVLPGGTTSVLAYELGIPRPAVRALAVLLAGRDRRMRVGRTSSGEIFLLMLSAGPDSVVLERLRPLFKRAGGRVGVALQAVCELLSTRPLPRLRVRTGDEDEPATGGWAIVGNGRCYGGPYHATPGADPFATELEVVVQRAVGRAAAVAFALSIPRASHVRRDDVTRRRVDRVRLEPASTGDRIRYQLDGDLAGTLPVEAVIDADRLRVRLPAG
jgi:diacylglycerol kinase family enzyme